jgi:hypothetical protein
LIAHRGGPRAYVLQAVVTHIGHPFWQVAPSKRAQASDCSALAECAQPGRAG